MTCLAHLPASCPVHGVPVGARFTGGNARNHVNIANFGIAVRIKPWLKTIENDRGDLRN